MAQYLQFPEKLTLQEQPAPAFKTVLCKYFELGNCSKGDECTYAHGIEELQTREAGTYKTVLCKFFEAGSCSRGASCTFAHGEEDLLNESLGAPATGSTASAGSCAVAATAFATTSLADAIAQSALELKGACCAVSGDGSCDCFRGVFLDLQWKLLEKKTSGWQNILASLSSWGYPKKLTSCF